MIDRAQTTTTTHQDKPLTIAEAEAALQAARETAHHLRFNAREWPAHRRAAIEAGDGQKLVAVRQLMAEAEDLATCAEIAAARAEVALAKTVLRVHNEGPHADAIRLMDFAKAQEAAAQDSDAVYSAGQTRRGAVAAIGAAMDRQRELEKAVFTAHTKAHALVTAALAKEENT